MDGGEQRSREAELRRQLDVAQALTHMGSWDWNLTTGVIRWSTELYRIYGLEPGSRAITRELVESCLHPLDRDRIGRELEAALQRRGGFAYRERILRPDGSTRTLDTIGEVLVDDTGVITELTGTCRDVTDEARREETIRFFGDVFSHVQIGLTAWKRAGSALQLVALNPAAEQLTGTPHAEAIGQTPAALFPVGGVELAAYARRIEVGVGGAVLLRLGARAAAPTFAVRAFVLPGEHVGISIEDVTAQRCAELVQEGERRALEMLAKGDPLSEILGVLVATIEAVCPAVVASILTVDDDGKHLRHGAAPSLPEEYRRAIDGLAIGPAAGACGTAVFRREPVYVTDIETDPLWVDFRHLVRATGLRACWSSPIFATDGRAIGSFAFYHPDPSAPDETTQRLMARAAHVTGIALERRALDEQLRALAARIEAAREDERTAIARDVHDQLGQALTALKLDVGWLARRTKEPELLGKLADMAHASDDVIASVRRISADLRPSILDDLGLRAAIEWQAEEFSARTGTRCVVHAKGGDLHLDRELATTVFRIFQEALTNVARHASAAVVDVTLGLERGQVRLEVADDGVGLPDVGPRSSTLGILGMGERARRLGGECHV
ncbi:MAG: GAF domain-containing protein, partial [Myxococcota bacterium]|nr:GAF domain-containing protein [Myxococcota bacterium]